jgi:protein-disulfide isomerase
MSVVPFGTVRSYVVSSDAGKVTVLVFTSVTCPYALVVIVSIAVKLPPYPGESDEVVLLLDVVS